MKKFLFTIIMVVCANGMFAQTEVGDSIVGSKKVYKPETVVVNAEDMAKLVNTFQQYAAQAQNEDGEDLTIVPVVGKNKFAMRHRIAQRLEVSVIGGSDSDDGDSGTMQSSYKTQDDVYDDLQDGGKFNYGLNIGYSLLFVPGKVQGDSLRLNRLGMAYSFGLVASFDRQEYYGVTCDFLGKIGFEAGYGHKMGIGMDFLLGTGKSAGDYDFMLEENGEKFNVNTPYTKWCLKYGAQLWIRSNLLKASVKNTDIRLFVRYVYSKNPENPAQLAEEGVICNWKKESWTFGLTFCYEF